MKIDSYLDKIEKSKVDIEKIKLTEKSIMLVCQKKKRKYCVLLKH